MIETVAERRILTDGARTLELHLLRNGHADGMIMVYLPNEKLLVEADVFKRLDQFLPTHREETLHRQLQL